MTALQIIALILAIGFILLVVVPWLSFSHSYMSTIARKRAKASFKMRHLLNNIKTHGKENDTVRK